MEQSTITFVINGKTFSLRAGDSAAIGAIPEAERQQLITLLEAVRQQEERSRAIARRAVDNAAMAARGTVSGQHSPARPERLGSGDVDALMARLVMEEKTSRKPAPTKQAMYKWVLGVAGVLLLLVLVF